MVETMIVTQGWVTILDRRRNIGGDIAIMDWERGGAGGGGGGL